MTNFLRLCPLFLAATGNYLGAYSGDWVGGNSGNDWDVDANWSPSTSYPQNAGDSANFGNTGTTSVTLDTSSIVITELNFSNQDFTITGGGNSLTMESYNSTNPSINVSSGNQTVNCTINASDDLTINLDGNLTSIGSFSIPFIEISNDITITGTGTLTLNNSVIQNANYNPNNFTLTDATLNVYSPPSGSAGINLNGPGITNINNGRLIFFSGYGGSNGFNGGGQALNLNGGLIQVIADEDSEASINGTNLVLYDGTVLLGDPIINAGETNFSAAYTTTIYGGLLKNYYARKASSFNAVDLSMYGGAVENSGVFNYFSFMMSGGTFINDSSGLVTYGSNPSAPMQINGGTYTNNGITQSLTVSVNSPGIVSGNGTFQSALVNNGTVIPGFGALTVDQYTQTASGNLIIQAFNSSLYGSLNSLGTTTLDGTLTIAPYPNATGFDPAVPLTIVTGDLGGTTFSQIVNLFPNTVNAVVSYNPASVVLQLFPLLNSFVSFKEIAFSTVNQINLRLFNRLDQLVDPCLCGSKVQFYADAIGAFGQVQTNRQLVGTQFNTAGVLTGVDFISQNSGFGVAFDYERVNARGRHNFGNFDTSKYHFSGYATCQVTDALRLDGILGGGWENTQLRRNAGLFSDQKARSSFNGTLFDAFMGAEYFTTIRCVNLIPFAGLQYINTHLDRFKEAGVSGFAYMSNGQQLDSLRSLLGVKLNTTYQVKGITLIPQINVAWQYEFLDHSKHLSFSNVDFLLPSQEISFARGERNIALAGVDLALLLDRLSFDLSYEFEGNGRYNNNFFTLEAAYAF